MNKNEAANFIEQIMKPIWPEWKYSAMDVDIWASEVLSRFDWDTCKSACRRAKAESDFDRKPNSKKVIDFAYELMRSQKQMGKAVKTEIPEPTVFIQMTDHENTKRIGQFVPVYSAPEFALSDAQKMLGAYREQRGGTWQIVQDATWGEMRRSQIELNLAANPIKFQPVIETAVSNTDTCPACKTKLGAFSEKLKRFCRKCGHKGCYKCFSVEKNGEFIDQCPKCEGKNEPSKIEPDEFDEFLRTH
jgi:hypothetical protein